MPYMTVMHTAEAVKAIYKNNDFEDFTLIEGFFDPKNDNRLGWAKDGDMGGASVGLYKYNRSSDQYILAFRGSKGTKDWVTDDRQITVRTTVDRSNDCIRWVERVKENRPGAFMMLAGHSLGGYLAQVVGVKCDMPFITYNAPPAAVAARLLTGGGNILKFKKGVNLRINWDPVSGMIGSHVGPVITLPHVGMNIADAHTGGAIKKSMDQFNGRNTPAMAFITASNR